jgi:serine/threonine protein kinase
MVKSKKHIVMDLSNILGQGKFGIVISGKITRGSVETPIAIKISEEDLTEEASIMFILKKHKNIVSFIDLSKHESMQYLVMEFCEHGSLYSLLKLRGNGKGVLAGKYVNKKTDASIALDIVKGMDFLVVNKIVHRDLAARNILLDSKLTAKVSDFGLSKKYNYSNYYKQTKQGTLPIKWSSHEVFKTHKFSMETDMWSFGVLLLEMAINGEEPFIYTPNKDIKKSFRNVIKLYQKPIMCNNLWHELMLLCWQRKASQRPTFKELIILFKKWTSKNADISIKMARKQIKNNPKIETQQNIYCYKIKIESDCNTYPKCEYNLKNSKCSNK